MTASGEVTGASPYPFGSQGLVPPAAGPVGAEDAGVSRAVATAEGPFQPRGRFATFLGKLSTAAVCALPAAEYAISDIMAGKAAQFTNEVLPGQYASLGAVAAAIALQSVAAGVAVARYKGMQKAGSALEAYLKQGGSNRVEKVLVAARNAPFKGLEKVGKFSAWAGEKLADERHARSTRVIGRLLVDAGAVNVAGTTGVILDETLNAKAEKHEPPSMGRIARLSGLMGATWFVGANVVEWLYHGVPAVQPPLAFVGHAFETVTSMHIVNPLETPVGSTAIIGTTALLAVFGWKLAGYQSQPKP